MAMVPYSNGGPGGPQGSGPGAQGGPGMYGPPIKDKGPSMTTVMSDNMAVAVAKTFRTAHKVHPWCNGPPRCRPERWVAHP